MGRLIGGNVGGGDGIRFNGGGGGKRSNGGGGGKLCINGGKGRSKAGGIGILEEDNPKSPEIWIGGGGGNNPLLEFVYAYGLV